ncbi:hypothetical protein JOD64_000808 [Micromonospora luteifusca]|uniref:Uncharacterized protein n=1 Tax=Micromonospora luteifusca TaxID=709860 RepID=A0ABS2LN18_9ACTN|nr:hypothetical protein [Micromonospora luteifusca]MBM7489586.1 hypothetical protein [Micromonospora luteifusca]
MNGPLADELVGDLELVHTFTGPMPTGRIFVNFPKWGDEVPATVAELRDGREVPFPDQAWNQPARDDDAGAFVSVQSIVVDSPDEYETAWHIRQKKPAEPTIAAPSPSGGG